MLHDNCRLFAFGGRFHKRNKHRSMKITYWLHIFHIASFISVFYFLLHTRVLERMIRDREK